MTCGAASAKGLSAGEKRMLAKARQILVSELALAEHTNEDKAETIRQLLPPEAADASAPKAPPPGGAFAVWDPGIPSRARPCRSTRTRCEPGAGGRSDLPAGTPQRRT